MKDVTFSLISYTLDNILHQILYVPCPVCGVIGTLWEAQEGMIGSLVQCCNTNDFIESIWHHSSRYVSGKKWNSIRCVDVCLSVCLSVLIKY